MKIIGWIVALLSVQSKSLVNVLICDGVTGFGIGSTEEPSRLGIIPSIRDRRR